MMEDKQMADFSKVDWVQLLGLIAQVQAEVKSLQDAQGVEAQAAAVGQLADTFISAAEAFSGKDLVDNDVFRKLMHDTVAIIGDVQGLKPKPPQVV